MTGDLAISSKYLGAIVYGARVYVKDGGGNMRFFLLVRMWYSAIIIQDHNFGALFVSELTRVAFKSF